MEVKEYLYEKFLALIKKTQDKQLAIELWDILLKLPKDVN